MKNFPKKLSVLFIGNSFAIDTTDHAPALALSLGVKEVFFGTLYVGGCSIKMHFDHASENKAVYEYHTNDGSGWKMVENFTIKEAIGERAWDWIVIQHGTGDGGRYTSAESYAHLDALISYVKALAPNSKLAFNMTWVGEPTSTHHEISSYGGDTAKMYDDLTAIKREIILPKKDFDKFIPTGTAVENARTGYDGLLTRDTYHLSYGLGRLIASLTLLSTICEKTVDEIDLSLDGVGNYEKALAVESVKNALISPLTKTQSSLK